ncbi:MAG TPA: hypothetical protein PLT03_03150, partial [Bacillota bacterium]|nr:hypothetical protein [Bacillota bacterium]
EAVRQQLVIRELLASNNLKVTSAEIDRAIEMMAGKPGEVKPADLKKLRENKDVRSSVSRLVAQDKAIRLLSTASDADPEAGRCTQNHDHEHKHEHNHDHEHGNEVEDKDEAK